MNKYSHSDDFPMITQAEMRQISDEVRACNLRTIHGAGGGHTGGDLSATDILATLYLGGVLRIDPRDPHSPDRDRFFMSKGHSSALLYTVLAFAGFIEKQELDTYMRPLSRLAGHPTNKIPGVEANTGSLGHGLPMGLGAALAAKMDGVSWRVFVLTGDGELQAGSNWEAAIQASRLGLDNLTLIVDRNGLQLSDWTEKIGPLEPLAEKWRSFHWAVHELDGHDHAALLDTFHSVPLEKGKPSCIIARTHKGKGVSFIEDRPGWHHRVPTDEELVAALRELEVSPRG